METIEMELDKALVLSDVVTRIAHRYPADHLVELGSPAAAHYVRLKRRRPNMVTHQLLQRARIACKGDPLCERVGQHVGELYAVLTPAALLQPCPRIFK